MDGGGEAVPDGLDGIRDVTLAEAIVASHLDGRPRDRPTRLPGNP